MPRIYLDKDFKLRGTSWSSKEIMNLFDLCVKLILFLIGSFLIIVIGGAILNFFQLHTFEFVKNILLSIESEIRAHPIISNWFFNFYYYLIASPLVLGYKIFEGISLEYQNLKYLISISSAIIGYIVIYILLAKMASFGKHVFYIFMLHPFLLIALIFFYEWIFAK